MLKLSVQLPLSCVEAVWPGRGWRVNWREYIPVTPTPVPSPPSLYRKATRIEVPSSGKMLIQWWIYFFPSKYVHAWIKQNKKIGLNLFKKRKGWVGIQSPYFWTFMEPRNEFREESNPPAYVSWWASTTNMVVVPAREARNRFLKGLQIRAQYTIPLSSIFIQCPMKSHRKPSYFYNDKYKLSKTT